MSAIVTAILALMQEVIPIINSASGVAKVIAALIQLIPIVVKEAKDLVPEVKNIIAAMQSNAAVTPDQTAQLQALDAQVDADFEAAATAADAADTTAP